MFPAKFVLGLMCNHRNLALLAFNFLRKDVLRNELSLLKTDSAYNHGTDGKVAT
jgi:hypothetical protein